METRTRISVSKLAFFKVVTSFGDQKRTSWSASAARR